MRRRVNVRFLGWALAGTAVLSGVVALVHEFQVRRNVGALVARADQALARGELQQAAFYYNQYLSYQPDDTGVLVRYGRTLQKLATTPDAQYQAFLILDQAVRRRPTDAMLRRGTMELALDLERFPEALEHLEVLLQDSPKDAGLWQRQGWCREGLGEFDKAENCYRRAIQNDPSYLVAYADLANLLQFHLGRPKGVTEILDRMVAANPKSYQAHLARARYSEAIGAHGAAWADLVKAYALKPGEPDVLLTKARIEEKKGDLAAARATLQQGLEAHPSNLQFCKSLAWLEVRAKRPAEAVRWLQRGLKKARQAPELLLALADLLLDNGSPAEAQAAIAQLRQEYPAPEVADCLQARLWMQQGDWPRALAALEKIRPRLEKEPGWSAYADYLLGRGYARLGDVERALVCFQRTRQQAPAWTVGRFGLGAALLETGRVNEALNELQRIRGADDVPSETVLLLAQALLFKNRALPKNRQDWDEVAQALKQAAEQNPNSVRVILLHADMLAEQQQFVEARALLEDAADKYPKAVVELLVARADLARVAGQMETARVLLQEADQKQGDRLAVRLAWVRWCAAQGGAESGIGLRILENDVPTLPPADQLRLLRELARTYLHRGDAAAAARLWRTIAQKQPQDLQSRFQLFDLALQNQEEAAARKALEEVRRVEGERGILWRYGQAALVATFAGKRDAAQRDKARQHLAEVKKLRPNWGRVELLEGWIDDQEGREEQAIAHYLRAVQQGEAQLRTVTRLVQLLYERRRLAEADLVLRQYEERGPLTGDLVRTAVEIALLQHDSVRALALARQAVPDTSRDYREHLWRAQVLHRASEDVQAEQVLRRLTQDSPAIPDVWVALVEYLAQTGQRDRGAAVVAQAEAALPADRRLWAVGRCWEILGEIARAEELFRKDVEAQPYAFLGWRHLAEYYLRQEQYAKAEKWLRKLVQPANQLPEEIVVRARRQLALALARQGDAAKFQDALTLLAANRQGKTPSREDNVTRALVLATQSRHQPEARELLEQARQHQPLGPDEEFTLANLYLARDDGEKAMAIFQRLVLLEGEKPIYLVPYIRGLIQRRDLTAAQLYLDKLARQAPQNPDLAALRGSLQRAQKKLTSQLR